MFNATGLSSFSGALPKLTAGVTPRNGANAMTATNE